MFIYFTLKKNVQNGNNDANEITYVIINTYLLSITIGYFIKLKIRLFTFVFLG